MNHREQKAKEYAENSSPKNNAFDQNVRGIISRGHELSFLAGYDCDKWQRVEDGLPEDMNYVLGYCADSKQELKTVVCYYNFYVHKWNDNLGLKINGITHFQPLPNPPQI